MEKEFHSKLKNIVSKQLKNKGFSVKKEAKIKRLAIDITAKKDNSIFLFECEIPSKYDKFIYYKNKTKKELLKLAFQPHNFVKKCLRKVYTVLRNTNALPILVIPADYFPIYLKQKFSKIGLNAWFLNIETSKIEKFKPKKKFKPIEKETKKKSIASYLIDYFWLKYGSREKLYKVIERIKKDKKFFEKLKMYYENNDFKKLNKLIDS